MEDNQQATKNNREKTRSRSMYKKYINFVQFYPVLIEIDDKFHTTGIRSVLEM